MNSAMRFATWTPSRAREIWPWLPPQFLARNCILGEAFVKETYSVTIPSLSRGDNPATAMMERLALRMGIETHGPTSILRENADTLKPSNMRSSPPTNPESRFSTASLKGIPQPPFEKEIVSPILESVSIEIWVLW